METSFVNSDDYSFNVAFWVVDGRSYYLFVMSRNMLPSINGCNQTAGKSVLMRIMPGSGDVGGTVTDSLATSNVGYVQGVATHVAVQAVGYRLMVGIDTDGDGEVSDSELIFDVADGTHSEGGVALYAYQNGASESPCANGGCYFDAVRVFDIHPDSDGDLIADSEEICNNGVCAQ